MLLSNLVNHTRCTLSLFTDLFTDNKAISSIVKSGDTVTVTSTDHGLSVDNLFMLSNVKTKVQVSSISTSNGIATATCATNHDLTFSPNSYIKTVEIVSTEPSYNGRFDLLQVPDIKTFTFRVDGAPPSATGHILTFHNLGFNGRHKVASVIDDNNFTFTLENDSLIEAGGENMLLMGAPRISSAANFERAFDSYTEKKSSELWGFFVVGDTDASNDRRVDNDSGNQRTRSQEFKVLMITPVSFYVFIPSPNEIAGSSVFDSAQKLVRPIYRSLCGLVAERLFSGVPDNFILMPSGHGIEVYNSAFMCYRYDFEYTEYIYSDGASQDQSEFMANTGDLLPALDTSAFKFMNWKIDDKDDTILKNDNYEVQN